MRLAVLVAFMWPLAAAAQGGSVPSNVNDCTFYRDPAALRDCIDRSRIGERSGPAIGALPPNPDRDTTGSLGSPESQLLEADQLNAARGTSVEPGRKARRSVVIEQVAPRKSQRSHRPAAPRR